MRPDAQHAAEELVEFLREKASGVIHLSRHSYWTLCEDVGFSEALDVEDLKDLEMATKATFSTCFWCLRCV